jgi:hypothetical protein
MILKEVQAITPGDLIERTRGHRSGQIALVIAAGADKYQVILRNWLRIQYLKLGDYEWVQKDGVARVSRD